MATIVNARDVILQATIPRVLPAALPSNQTVDFSQVNGATKPADNATAGATWGANIGSQPTSLSDINAGEGSKLSGIAAGADVTSSILASSGTTIVMSNANLFKSSSGIAGVFIGSGGIVGKNGSGSTTFSVNGGTGAASFVGDITGGSSLNIIGTAKFGGATTSLGNTWACVANESLGSYGGVLGYTSTGRATYGYATTSGIGASGTSNSGTGMVAVSSSGTGLATQSTSWNALQITGKSVQDSSTYTWNGYAIAAPAGSTTTCLHNDGVYRDPVTTARVNAAYGIAASGVCQKIVTDSGTATVSGTGLNYNCTITGYQFTGSSNNVGLAPVSDRRLKKRIKREKLGLDFVMELKPVSYQMKGQSRTQHGFIAQDVEAILARRGLADVDDALATESEAGVKGTDYLSMIAIFALAIQQQQAQIDELRTGRS